ncbi:MAG: hypothetical protein QNJ70_14395 [Xenococcaceae cyanobacterium MO_207.B15]|nr:hypothetical protein [Xenococcaceae cyanobacterium MO_207.B15]
MMKFLTAIPLFALIWVLYHLVILWGSSAILSNELLHIPLVSGAIWKVTVSDLLLMAGLIILYLEVLQATLTGITSVVNHTLSTLVCIVFIVEFLTISYSSNSTFFLLGLMSLIDVLAGFTITIAASRRDIIRHD